jgi:hypothetical protein
MGGIAWVSQVRLLQPFITFAAAVVTAVAISARTATASHQN